MIDGLKYQHTPDMGEISGFGKGYEEACQRMLDAGVRWLDEHPQAEPQFHGYKGVYGILEEDNADAEALSKACCAAVSEHGGPTGAMHQAVLSRCMFIKAHGWEKYCAELRKSEATP